jgi:predicted nucleic acid-binding protein
MSEAEALQFVDTNVLIYAHDRTAGIRHEQAKQLLRELWENRKGCLSVQVLQEFYVNVTQKVPKPLAPEAAAGIIADLSSWQVHQPGVNDVLDAIALQNRFRLSFWDAMIVASAIALGCEILWSEDLKPGQRYATLEVRSPFE